jgi:hypothetical protein
MNPDLAFQTARELMIALGFTVEDRGVPTVEVVPVLSSAGSYYPSRHHVAIASRKEASMWTTLVHEMAHSMQPDHLLNGAGKSYWLQDGSLAYDLYKADPAEVQAYAVEAALEHGVDMVREILAMDPGFNDWGGVRCLRKAFGPEKVVQVLRELRDLMGPEWRQWTGWAYWAKQRGVRRAPKPAHLPVSLRKAVNAWAVAAGAPW